MRAEQVIATHGNTDFDAFGAMLAARLLYPDAVVAVAALNRNVRDFYRLHAEELGAIAEVSRLELDAIRRLIVVEVTSASRLGELEAVALDPERREGRSSTTTASTASRTGSRRMPLSCRATARSRRRSSGSSRSASSRRPRSRRRRSRSGSTRTRARSRTRRRRSATWTRSRGACGTERARISSTSTSTRRSPPASASC